MTPSSSPVREVSVQENCPDSTTITEHNHPQQPDRDDELQRRSIDGQVTHAVAELEVLPLKIDTFTKGKREVVSNEEKDTDASPESPASPFNDPEEGSQTSCEESWASFPSSGSSSTTDSHSSAGEDEEPTGLEEEDAPLPSPETTFKFHEEFSSHGDINDNYGLDPLPPPPPPPPPSGEEEEEFAMGKEDEEDLPYSPPGPWSTSAVPRWAFLRSSNSLPVLGLGPGDFYHGGSALRHEVSAYEDEDEDKEVEGSDEDVESRGSHDIATVGVVHL